MITTTLTISKKIKLRKVPIREKEKKDVIKNIPAIMIISKNSGYSGIFAPQDLHFPLHIINEIIGNCNSGGIFDPQLSQIQIEESTGKSLPEVKRRIFVVANPPT